MGIGQPWVCRNEGREALRLKEAYGVFLSSNGQVGYAVGLGAALRIVQQLSAEALTLRLGGDVDAVDAPGGLPRRFLYANGF